MENVLDDFICPFTEMYTFNAHFKIVEYMCVCGCVCVYFCVDGTLDVIRLFVHFFALVCFLLLFFHDLRFHQM